MSVKTQKILAVVALILGVILLMTPIFSNGVYQLVMKLNANDHIEYVEQTANEALVTARERAVLYNNETSVYQVIKGAGDVNESVVETPEYSTVMNLSGDGIMGVLRVPSVGIYISIAHGTDEDVLAQYSGHLQGTSLPYGGESTHCVLTGHTGLPNVKVFDGLDQIQEGDLIYLEVLAETHIYRVYSTEVVEPEDVSSLGITKDKDLLTLVTCTPYGINSHRLLVHAERDLDAEKAYQLQNSAQIYTGNPVTFWDILPVAGPILILLGLIGVLVKFALEKKKIETRISGAHHANPLE